MSEPETQARTNSDKQVFQSRPPTEEEAFLIDWGKRTYATGLDSMISSLQAITAIDAILFGGSLAFFDGKVFNQAFRVPFLACLILSFLCGCLGLMPVKHGVRPHRIADLRAAHEKFSETKATRLLLAGALLIVALVLAFIGTVYRPDP